VTDGSVVRYWADILENAGSNLGKFLLFVFSNWYLFKEFFSLSIKDFMDVSEEGELCPLM
jgi:hypothetical protein